jgi:Putative methyltransferase
MSTVAQEIDQAKLEEFMGRFVGDLGAALSAALVVIGDRLGLYRAMADGAAVSAPELAQRTGTDERYVREWLSNQAAGGYVSYDPAREEFFLSPEQSLALAQEGSPAFIPGAFQVATAAIKDEEKIERAFESGHGVGWHEHHHDLFAGTERFFRPGYAANLMTSWIPALDGMQPRLRAGALVADVGCGHGASTIMMAQAYPRSEFVGFDYHVPSITHARAAAFYGASTLVCTPASRDQEVGLALGAQAGEARLREVATAGGFTRFRERLRRPSTWCWRLVPKPGRRSDFGAEGTYWLPPAPQFRQPRPTYGIPDAITVSDRTFAVSGSSAMYSTASATSSTDIVGSDTIDPSAWSAPAPMCWVMSVAALPMSIWPQAIPWRRPSSASALVKPLTPCLVAV